MEDIFRNITPNGFEFAITNGLVTGMERVIGTHTLNLNLPSKATFAVGAGTVTETLTGTKATEVIQFTQDPTNASVYHLTADIKTVTTPTTTNGNGQTNGYSFTIAGTAVTGMQYVWGSSSNTHTQNLHLSPTSTLSVTGSTVTETTVQGNKIETIQFVQPVAGGLYAVASDTTTFIQPGSAKTLLSVDPYDRVKFTVDGSGNVTALQAVHPDGTLGTAKTLPLTNAHSTITFTQLQAGYIEETITNGTHSSYEVFHDGNGDGIFTSIAHGRGTTVDLVGLQAQITAPMNAVI